jgi:hypothetical protein
MTEATASAFSTQYFAPFTEPMNGSLTASNNIAFQATLPLPVVAPAMELTPEQELVITKHLAEVAPAETIKLEAFDKAMRIMQKLMRGSTSNSMPTAMKLKSWEVPLLQYALEYSSKSPLNRRIVVRKLVENLEIGSGFFSINRAKQGLKVISKKTGLQTLEWELENGEDDARRTAAHLLGWMKHEKALMPLLRAFCVGPRSDRRVVGRVLKQHYSHLLPYFASRHFPEFEATVKALLERETNSSVNELVG